MYSYESFEKDTPRISVSKLADKLEYDCVSLLNYFRSDGIFVKDKTETVSTIEALIILHYIANKDFKRLDYNKILEECVK